MIYSETCDMWWTRDWYALHDYDDSLNGNRGMFHISKYEACEYNAKGFGIFWTVNQMAAGTRKGSDVIKILSWAVDLDEGTKDQQIELIKKFIEPSAIVESKNGFHCYYDTIDATLENHAEIQSRLIYNLHGDIKAKDLARVLRCPNFGHWKDRDDPYLVRHRDPTGVKYTEAEMLKSFPSQAKIAVQQKKEFKSVLRKEKLGEDFWEKVWSIDCKEALSRLSGTPAIGLDQIDFKPTGRGFNLVINGKPTSCWVDLNGRIGSLDGGGPTIWQWLNWYHRDHKKTHKFMKEHFPEVF